VHGTISLGTFWPKPDADNLPKCSKNGRPNTREAAGCCKALPPGQRLPSSLLGKWQGGGATTNGLFHHLNGDQPHRNPANPRIRDIGELCAAIPALGRPGNTGVAEPSSSSGMPYQMSLLARIPTTAASLSVSRRAIGPKWDCRVSRYAASRHFDRGHRGR